MLRAGAYRRRIENRIRPGNTALSSLAPCPSAHRTNRDARGSDPDPSARALRNHRLRLRPGRGGPVQRAGPALRGRAHDHRAPRVSERQRRLGARQPLHQRGTQVRAHRADAPRAEDGRRGVHLHPQHRLRSHRPRRRRRPRDHRRERGVRAGRRRRLHPDADPDGDPQRDRDRQLGGEPRLQAGRCPRQGPARPDRRRRRGRAHRHSGDPAAARVRVPGAGLQQRADGGGDGGVRLPR